MKSSCNGRQVRAWLVRLGEVREVLEVNSVAKAGGGSTCDACEDRGPFSRWAGRDKERVIDCRASRAVNSCE